jgi:drug/metabolite transporter (DMT)-like permease
LVLQATMIGRGIWGGERLRRPQLVGLMLALAGLVGLLLPGLTAAGLQSAKNSFSARSPTDTARWN